ncbi:alpha/beta hydrolase [Propionibacteriaceae bacterium G1746]|uniref:alpha/beta hydrolase n=1 Tax=Aestuariimicrobium sp. G57 TaxID=3418485 RepID=UPI003C1D3955
MRLDADAVLWDHTAGKDAPLLVLLHGLGSHEGDLFGLVPHLPDYVNVASLRAPLAVANGGRAWFNVNIGEDGRPWHEAHEIEAAGQDVVAWLDSLGETYPRVALLGFSQGAAITMKVASMIPDRLECVVALSGLLPKTVDDAQPTSLPAFIAAGDFDQVIGADRTAAVISWAESHLAAEVHHYPMAHEVIAPELADVRDFLGRHLG